MKLPGRSHIAMILAVIYSLGVVRGGGKSGSGTALTAIKAEQFR